MSFRTVGLGLALFAWAAGAARAQTLEPFVANANLNWPVGITHAGDGSGRLFFTGQNGVLWVHDGSQLRDEPFLDVSPLVRFQPLQGEEGLVGTAFHPSYETNGLLYVFYTNLAGDNVIARYRVSATNANVADPASATILLTIPHTTSAIHNGGQLQFGPDGYLYVGSGDGGPAGDPSDNAQNLGVLLGKILRLDVDGPGPYGIPPTNPFVGVAGVRPEIWAYGLRNPWRFSFDRLTGALFIGDVGQERREEIDLQPAGVGGLNYGWDDMEGTLCYEPLTGCLTRNRVLPILEHDHASGDCAVVGGYRYRGTQVAGLPGKYVYGDFCSQLIHVAREGPPGQWAVTQEIFANFNISAFGEDEAGELYVARYQSGSSIYRVVGVTPAINVFPEFDAIEGTGGTSEARVPIKLSPTLQTVTARYETLPATALPGQDYAPVTGVLTFAPSHDEQVQELVVPLVPDAVPEDLESFQVRLFDVMNAQPAAHQDFVHIFDDDPPPAFRVDDAAALEGDGPFQLAVRVRVWPRSPSVAVVHYATAAGSATPGADFEPASGNLTFLPGTSAPQNVVVGVVGDRTVELDETFSVVLSSPVGADLGDAEGTVTILDDDAPPLSNLEVAHGTTLRADLSDGQPDFYRLAQEPRSSYEAILDEVSGDLVPGLLLSRVGTDNVTTVQSAVVVGSGPALALRWRNQAEVVTTGQHLRVGSSACGKGCGPDDTYRLRVRETTASVARFNVSGSQATVLVLQNAAAEPLTGTLSFWSPEGELLGQHGLALGARSSLALNAATVPGVAGRSGSITIAHDGAYGTLAGKAVALEPSTGFSFDSPIVNRAR